MRQKLASLFVIILLSFISCHKEEEQNLDISVTGRVVNQSNVGVGNVTIYIQRGKPGNYSPTNYVQYQTVTTNASGNYNYLVQDDSYPYQICCDIPAGYSSVDQSCTFVHDDPQSVVQ